MSLVSRLVVLVVGAVVVAGSAAHALGAPPCWEPPVTAWVVDPFREPECRWCPGNRGIEFGVSGRQVVRSVQAGIVTFAGSVAGTRYVVVQHLDGWKLTYGQLTSVAVQRNDRVGGGAVIGSVRDRYFLGLRIDGRYRDPAPHLAELRGRPRLVPTDGRTPRPAPPATWACGARRRR